jgi:hypothetical protein
MVQCICLDCCSDCWTKESIYLHGLYLVWMTINCLNFAGNVFQPHSLSLMFEWGLEQAGGLHSFEALLCELFYYIPSLFFRLHLPVNDKKRFTRRNAYLEWNIDNFIWKAALSAGVAFCPVVGFSDIFLLRCISDVSRWRSGYHMFLAHLCVAVK